jgi:hypothetical protein
MKQNNCQFCGKETKNIKYCSKSCQIKQRNKCNNPMKNPISVEKMRKKVTGMVKKPRSKESNNKISKSLTGRKLSKIHKSNVSKGLKKYYNENYQWQPIIDKNDLENCVKKSTSFYQVSKKLNICKPTIISTIKRLNIDYSHFSFLNKNIENIDDFKKYKRNVWNITNKFKKDIMKNWNKKCFYTNVLLDNENRYLVPTIDHKISIKYGFKNSISPEIIGNIENLCICARWYNSFKHTRTIFEQVLYHSEKLL